MKLLFLTGSRGEWGYIRPLLKAAQSRGVDYGLCVTNMHLLPGHGRLVDDIEAEGFSVSHRIYMSLEGHDHHSMAKSQGVFLSSFVDAVASSQPDWLILAGDRGEQLMGAIAGAYTYTPTAHIQAGERSGNIDGVARHAIAKLVHLHFAANSDAADRLARLGEEAFRIHMVGAPQLDELRSGEFTSWEKLAASYALDPGNPFLLVAQHPVTEQFHAADEQVDALMSALRQFDVPKIWILPNNDAGSDRIRGGLHRLRDASVHLLRNVPREDFLGLLRQTSCIVGNSSAGLLEAPTFQVPAVNIGRRQQDRVRGANVVDADFDVHAIVAAIKRCLDPSFRAGLLGSENPYGDGQSAPRIMDILQATPVNDRLLIKQHTY